MIMDIEHEKIITLTTKEWSRKVQYLMDNILYSCTSDCCASKRNQLNYWVPVPYSWFLKLLIHFSKTLHFSPKRD